MWTDFDHRSCSCRQLFSSLAISEQNYKMTQEVAVGVQSSLAVCKTLRSLLTASFGPNALQVMYTSTTGKVLLTSDGSTILGATHVSHPIGRWLIDRVIKFHTHTGDHAKSVIFLVTSILEEIAQELDSSSESVDRKSADIIQHDKVIKLGRALQNVLQDEFPKMVLPVLCRHSLSVSEMDFESVNAMLLSVINTQLSSHLTPKQAKVISHILMDFIRGYGWPRTDCSYFMHLQRAMQTLLDNFEVTCLETVGLPYESSYIVNGIIISRDAVTTHQWKTGLHRKFVILGFNPLHDSPEQPATLIARTVEDLLLNMQHTRTKIMHLVTQLVDCNVTVLLSTECLPALMLALLQNAAITVIHMVPTDEIKRLIQAANVNIIHEITSHLESSFVGDAREVKPLIFGSRRFTQITLDNNNNIQAKHLILCSPSEGMCKVLSQSVCNAVSRVRCLVETNPTDFLGLAHSTVTPSQPVLKDCKQRGLLISAGGAAELLASNILDHECTAHKDDYYKSAALKIISHALLCIPRAIHQNSFAGKGSAFLNILNQVQSRSASECAMGINGKSGELCFPHERGAVECMASKYLLWSEVIEIVLELLKMDMIIPVSRITRSRDDDGNADDDNSF